MKLYARVKVSGKWKLVRPVDQAVCECRTCQEEKV